MTLTITFLTICIFILAFVAMKGRKSGKLLSICAVLVLTGCSIFSTHAGTVDVADSQKPPTSTPTETGTPTQTREPTATFTPTLEFLGYFTDTFDDNTYGWSIDRYTSLSDGQIELDTPSNSPWEASCDYCFVTPDNNYFEVDVTFGLLEEYATGILLDWEGCTTSEMGFILFQNYQDYEVVQAVFDENGEFQNWRYYFDWIIPIYSVNSGGYDTNTLGAEYEFATGSLFITLYANGDYVNRFQVYDYNGSEVCYVGILGDGLTTYDNFRLGTRE